MKLLVIGGGFFGMAAALAARERGYAVSIWDCQEPLGASRAAAGHVRASWAKGDVMRAMTDISPARMFSGLEWFGTFGNLRKTGERVRSWKGTDRIERDAWLLDPWIVLSALPVEKRLAVGVQAKGSGVWVREPSGLRTLFDRVIVAAGVWTDPLLARSALPPLGITNQLGSAVLVYPIAQPRDGQPTTWIPRVYVGFMARPWDRPGLWRVGDTVLTKAGLDSQMPLLQAALPLLFNDGWSLPLPGEPRTLFGARPVGPRGRFVAELVAPGIVALVGGRRMGLLLAGAAGHLAVDLAERVEVKSA